MRIIVAKDYETMSKQAAIVLAGQIIHKPNSVLGLATGSTPVGISGAGAHVIRVYLTSARWLPLTWMNTTASAPKMSSATRFMQDNLFSHINAVGKPPHPQWAGPGCGGGGRTMRP